LFHVYLGGIRVCDLIELSIYVTVFDDLVFDCTDANLRENFDRKNYHPGGGIL